MRNITIFLQKLLLAIAFTIFVSPVARADDFVCPDRSFEPIYGPLAELGGLSYDFDDNGEISPDECFAVRVYNGTDGGSFEGMVMDFVMRNNIEINQDNPSPVFILADAIMDNADPDYFDTSLYLNGEGMMMSWALCRYNEYTEKYDGNCTPALTSCQGSNNDKTLIDLWTNLMNTPDVANTFLDTYLDATEDFVTSFFGMSLQMSYDDIFMTEDPSYMADPENDEGLAVLLYGQCSASGGGLDLYDTISYGTDVQNIAYINGEGDFEDWCPGIDCFDPDNDQSYYGISEDNSWALDFGTGGIITGRGICSTRPGIEPWYEDNDGWWRYHTYDDNIVGTLIDETGSNSATYCYCNINGYRSANGNPQNLNSPYLYYMNYMSFSDAQGCSDFCSSECALDLAYFEMDEFDNPIPNDFRDSLFDLASTSGADLSSDSSDIICASQIDLMGNFDEFCVPDQDTYGQSYYGINDNNSLAMIYDNGDMISARAICSTRSGTDPWYDDNDGWMHYRVIDSNFIQNLTDETGENGATNCYCKLTGRRDGPNGRLQRLNSPALLSFSDYLDSEDCAGGCLADCAYMLSVNDLGFEDISIPNTYREALFNSVRGASDVPVDADGCPLFSRTFTSSINGPAFEDRLFGTRYDFNGDGEITIDECYTTRVYGSGWAYFTYANLVFTGLFGITMSAIMALPEFYTNDDSIAGLRGLIEAQYLVGDPRGDFFSYLVQKYADSIKLMFTQNTYGFGASLLVSVSSNESSEIGYESIIDLFESSINGQHTMGFALCRYNPTTQNYDANCTPIIQACNISDLEELDDMSGTTELVEMILDNNPNAFSLSGDNLTLFNQCSCSAELNNEPDDLCEAINCPDGYTMSPNGEARRINEILHLINLSSVNSGMLSWGCEPIHYTIEFDANIRSYSGSMSDIDCTYGTSCELPLNQYYKNNVRFIGWNTASNGSGTSYTDGQYVSNLTTENGTWFTLYAQWEFTIDLYQNETSNDNNINASIKVTSGSNMPAINTSNQQLNPPTREGYIFTGYWSARSGGTKYYNADMTSARTWSSNNNYTILYAQWQRINTVNLYQNVDEDNDNINATVVVNTNSNMPTINNANQQLNPPTREGYTFTGYWSERNGGTLYYYPNMTSAHAWDTSADGSLYAGWIHSSDENIFKFQLTTTPTTTSFQFKISAMGTFYVDCGNNGVLGGTNVFGKLIYRVNTTSNTYVCTWGEAGEYTIKFAGSATGYNISYNVAAISFYADSQENAQKVASISGSLGGIFGTFGQSQPRFYRTFYKASNMTGSIPATLFSGISGTPTSYMFYQTFYDCTNLSGYIPPELFAGISTSSTATYQMTNVFTNSGLATSCPTGTTQYTTGFESYFDGKVSCEMSCPANYHVPANHPEMCFSSVLHLDDTRPNDIVYLKDAATTSPALNIDIDDDGVNDGFANLTTTRTVMTDTSSHYLTVPVNGVTYYVCDDTSCPQ